MLKECDECKVNFDVFLEGHVSDFNWAMCGSCWMQELKKRGILVNA